MFIEKLHSEIVKIVSENPKTYVKMLKSRGFKNRYMDRSRLCDYIFENTKALDGDGFAYSFKTRVFWVLNRIESWDDPAVRCKICGKPIKNWNVVKIASGYKLTCCAKCERTAATVENRRTCMKRYGVVNVFACDAVKDELREKKDAIQARRERTKLRHFGNSTFNNPVKARQTKLTRYGGVWNLEKCRETMISRYGAPNPMQVASIADRQRNASYTLDGIRFDSSWEVFVYIWLRDSGIRFEYHPSFPEFWYRKSDGSMHRYFPDFMVGEDGEIWEPKGDNSFDSNGNPVKNGVLDWSEKHAYMKSIGVKFMFKADIEPFRRYVIEKYGADFLKTADRGRTEQQGG